MVHYLVLECVVQDFDGVTTPINGINVLYYVGTGSSIVPLLTVCFTVHNAGMCITL